MALKLKEIPVAEFLPYSTHVTPSIIATKAGDLLSVWKIGGRSHSSASDEERESWLRDLNNMVKGIGSEHVSFWTHLIRRKTDGTVGGEFTDPFCASLNTKYQSLFSGRDLRVNDLYLTVVYRPVVDTVLSILSRAERPSYAEKRRRRAAAVDKLTEISRTVTASLTRYDAELLESYEHNGFAFSAPARFLAYLVNGYDQPVPIMRERLCEYMATVRPVFSEWGEVGELGVGRKRVFGMLEVQKLNWSYPVDDGHGGKVSQVGTFPGHLNGLMELPCDFVLSQSFSCVSLPTAKGMMERKKAQLIGADDVGQTEIDQIDKALDQLVSGEFVIGEHHATLMVFGSDTTDVREHIAAATTKFQQVGIMPAPVDMALIAAFYSQFPGVWKYRPRPIPITSPNFLSFASLHNFMTGKPKGNPWGPAWTILKTVSGTPFYYNSHFSRRDDDSTGDRAAGNTLITGKTGVGKTVLLCFLIAQSQKYDPTIVAFDVDRGMEVAIRAMGGRYLPLRTTGRPSGFNPFWLDPTPANMLFLKQFVAALACDVSYDEEREIDQALDTMMVTIEDRSVRRLSLFVQSLNKSKVKDAPPTVFERLKKWCRGGEYGWLFDNAVDDLDLSSHKLYGFDTTELLDNPQVRTAVMMYLMHRTRAMIDGRRFAYVMDEYSTLLDSKQFEELSSKGVKTIRKANGIFLLATQELGAALEKPVGRVLMQQCATFVHLPNPLAVWKDYQSMGLTVTEFNIVRELGESSRRFLIKQGDNSAVAELSLPGFDDELLILSGAPDRAALAEEIIDEVGENRDVWIPEYLKRVRELAS